MFSRNISSGYALRSLMKTGGRPNSLKPLDIPSQTPDFFLSIASITE
jgi:hypothetical protein